MDEMTVRIFELLTTEQKILGYLNKFQKLSFNTCTIAQHL